ncbi:MAG: hypothetical protein H5U08_16210 [Thermogutta sp.]|uniref:hypothetical protein n=1 Tax=Thermogutta sp. TaxID=1962930 RepID=UPI0019B72692|nr:hypothetical protein [Thermogutta sp.]MBC7353903.1 hypothetical protein [Thermogutta sp.]
MRHFIVLALLCVTVLVVGEGLLSCLTSTGVAQKGTGQDTSNLWRRTKDGWEIAWWLVARPQFYSPGIHPGWLLLVQMTGVVGAYCVHRARRGRNRQNSLPCRLDRHSKTPEAAREIPPPG